MNTGPLQARQVAGRLGPTERTAALEAFGSSSFDVLVIGGGVVGAGVALDAATRGLSVALVEARDWASGTSSRSSKLIHGGLRYLERGDLRLVREALSERSLLIGKLAPHLVRPVPFLFPLARPVVDRLYVGAGLLLYDLLASVGRHSNGVPRHRHLSAGRALELAPSLRGDRLVGAVQYHDARVDDARHTLMLVRTAAAFGASVANRSQVVDFLREGDRVVGARVRDLEKLGKEITVRAGCIVNATGVWTDETQKLITERPGLHVRASKGIHLVVPRDRIDSTSGIILRTENSVLFVIPWGRHWIIGTTDTDWALDKAHPAASRRDIDYLLTRVNTVLARPLTHDDIVGVYAGLRPLLAGESEPTSRLSREHAISVPTPGFVVVAGGKYTTYRVMARDAVDLALVEIGRESKDVPCRTAEIPLLGADGYRETEQSAERFAAERGLTTTSVRHLIGRYGSLTADLLALIDTRPELAAFLPGSDDYLLAEALYAATHEGALHLEDVLTRRTRLSVESWDRGTSAAPLVARTIADVLDWDEQRIDREVRHYLARVEAERQSQRQDDDLAADAARLGAPDIIPPEALDR